MHLARTSNVQAIESVEQMVYRCAYCGSPLDPRFYFCTACSTPYKHVETVLPGVDPPFLGDGTLIARRAPRAMPVFWTYFAAVLGSALIAELAFGEKQVAARLILGTVVIGLTTCIVAALYWRSLVVQLKRFGFNHWAAWVGVAVLVPLLCLNYGYHMIFLRWFGVQAAPMGDPSWGQFAMITVYCILPATTEELAFRGLLQHWLQAALTPMRALVIASAMFSAMHFSVLSFPYLFLVGMLLGWTKWKTQSLYPSMLIHFLHNLIVIEMMSSPH